jgi:hypothetical protein
MTGNARPAITLLGTVRSADGKGVVRIEDRYYTEIDDLWSAITDPVASRAGTGELTATRPSW